MGWCLFHPLVEGLVSSSEMVALRDEFEGYCYSKASILLAKYMAPGSDSINNEFRAWVAKYPKNWQSPPKM
jgi:hypothetical protein